MKRFLYQSTQFLFGCRIRNSQKYDSIFADNDDLQLFIMGQVDLFSDARLTTSSGKHLEKVIYTQQSP